MEKRVLQCSSLGDKRYSPLYAKVKINNIVDTIDNHLQMSKRFTNHIPFIPYKYRFKEPDYFVINNKLLPKEYYNDFNKLLWYSYFKEHPELFNLTKTYDDFIDPLYGVINIDSVSKILKDLKKQGFHNFYTSCDEFLNLLKSTNDILLINKNIIESKQNIIIQEVNCQGIVNNPIFNMLAEKQPKIKEKYKEVCKKTTADNLFAKTQFINFKDKTICNIFSQYVYTYKTKQIEYDAFKKCLFTVKDFAIRNKYSISIPYGIGCNKDMFEWETIKLIIKDVFNDYPIILYKGG